MRLTRWKIFLFGLVASGCGSGCTLIRSATDLLAYKAVQNINEYKEQKRNREWAQEAWAEIVASSEMVGASEAYVEGFETGYSELLFRGGDGQPPAVPPKKFRRLKYQTPEGYRLIQDWFAGYRHGASVARESGFRRLVTGPSAFRATEGGVSLGTAAETPFEAPLLPDDTIPLAEEPQTPDVPVEVLPQPRKVPAAPSGLAPSSGLEPEIAVQEMVAEDSDPGWVKEQEVVPPIGSPQMPPPHPTIGKNSQESRGASQSMLIQPDKAEAKKSIPVQAEPTEGSMRLAAPTAVEPQPPAEWTSESSDGRQVQMLAPRAGEPVPEK